MMLSASPGTHARAQLLPGLPLHAGDVIGGRYRLESLVSADRSLVHLAAETAAKNAKVDVFVLAGLDVNDAVRLRFLAEARKCVALTSSHVARVLHVGVTSAGHPFVVQEKLPEQTLASLLEGGHAIDSQQAVDIALDVCDALLEAHALDVRHGELGTHSVHLAWNEEGPANVKLLGLGTDRALASLPLDASRLGPFVVRAPELLADRSAPATAASDVWGVGVVLYTMLAGAPPFMADSPSVLAVEVKSEDQASLAGVPDALADLVDACLAKNPAARPAGIREVADGLLAYATKPAESLARIVARAAKPAPSKPSTDLAKTAQMPAGSLPPAALPTVRQLPVATRRDGFDLETPAEPFASLPGSADLVTAEIGGETGGYKALELERLREVAKPAESELSIDVEVGPSVRDVGAASSATVPAAAAAPADDDDAAQHRSAPPVAITIPPPSTASAVTEARRSEPALAKARAHDVRSDAKIAATKAASSEPKAAVAKAAPARSWRMSGAMTAAACLAVGIVVGILVPRASSRSSTPSAGLVAAPTETLPGAAKVETLPAILEVTETKAAPAPPAVELAPPSMAASALPATAEKPATKTKALAATPPPPVKPAARAPASAPAPAPAHRANEAHAAPKPETTKAHDDDLRRFLDDRR